MSNPYLIRMRAGSRQGSDHIRLGYNNQDAELVQSFTIPTFGKTYCVGLVSDGCSGNPMFSHTEVGSNLMVLYAYRRILEFVCSGVSLEFIPVALYPSITEFLLDLMGKVMPETVIWSYPGKLKGRENWTSQKRFRNDYLAATLIGFISDGEDIVIFSAGDGIILVNDEIKVIDQDDNPEYPAISINQAGRGFDTRILKATDVYRLAVMTDGLKSLVKDQIFVDEMFNREPESLGLQFLLNTTDRPELMKDDCTAVTLERLA